MSSTGAKRAKKDDGRKTSSTVQKFVQEPQQQEPPPKVQEGRGLLESARLNHVESFNNLIENGIDAIRQGLGTLQVDPDDKDEPSIFIQMIDINLLNPMNKADDEVSHLAQYRKWTPNDCRLAHLTYSGRLVAKFQLHVGDSPTASFAEAELGEIPIMVRSKRCNLGGMTPEQLVAAGEDETEAGGYFIIHGLERVIRLLIAPRANYPMAIIRPSYSNRGALYTKYACLMRCMRPDGTTQTNTLHYTSDGGAYLRFVWSKEEWLVPLLVVAHACCVTTDRELAELLAGPRDATRAEGGSESNDLWSCVLVMLHEQSAKLPISSCEEARRYLGKVFRPVLALVVSMRWTDEEIGAFLIRKFVMVHTEDGQEKMLTLVTMFHKLMALVTGKVGADNQDTMSAHDVLLPGNLYGTVLREQLEQFMGRLKAVIRVAIRLDEEGKRKHQTDEFRTDATLFARYTKMAGVVGTAVTTFVSTGNAPSRSGMDLTQASGMTIVADKLNQARFQSHFAAVHRGQYFMEMKTTAVRKLLPETWGFLCPVHTPDGSPCGLLNHLASSCRAVTHKPPPQGYDCVSALLDNLGVQSWGGRMARLIKFDPEKHTWVLLDGVPVGFVEHGRVNLIEQVLRSNKIKGRHGFPTDIEIVCIPRGGRIYNGIFLFLGVGRLVRPIQCLQTGKTEWIGPLEQLFMNISVLTAERKTAHELLDAKEKQKAEGFKSGELARRLAEIPEQLPMRYTHEEIEPTRMLSTLAALTPFSNHNQSPRNMYQCQMLKQTMGTPYHNHINRMDNKVFRILFPQKPLVRTTAYNAAECDLHPTGTNAIVAVITYTGYDMEDAMLINKASYERGFKHGVVYKSKIIDAGSDKLPTDALKRCRFSNITKDSSGQPKRIDEKLDDEGLPFIGTYLTAGEPMYCTIDHTGKSHVSIYRDSEPCFVEQVQFVEGAISQGGFAGQRVYMKLRYQRNPVVGDKFSSRHGQKGVMSLLWPQEDMPFTESGMTPDILFNPHGFPSRMTIGMLIESIAAKAATGEGDPCANGTTFRSYKSRYDDVAGRNEDDVFLKQSADAAEATAGWGKAADYFGDVLVKQGFQRLGTEKMYSGIHGTEMETEIFVGVIYYQRLRHLVLDKAQARSRGPNDRVTNQPVKGRKRGGGIRFGEMERDSLLAHGTSYLLHDRLFRCSDFDVAYVCPLCGSILTPQASPKTQDIAREEPAGLPGEPWECPPCSQKQGRHVRCETFPIPWIFRYLTAELAAMNIKMKLSLTDRGRQASMTSSTLHLEGGGERCAISGMD